MEGTEVSGSIMAANQRGELSTEEFLVLVGSRVRSQRMNLGMSRKLLSHHSGVSERYLAQLEIGQGNISIVLLRKVAQAINAHLGELISEQPGSVHDADHQPPDRL